MPDINLARPQAEAEARASVPAALPRLVRFPQIPGKEEIGYISSRDP